MRYLKREWLWCVFAVLAMVCGVVEAQELEPNDSCAAPQVLGELSGPLSLAGGLDSTESFADIDFYQFSALPGQVVQVDMEGVFTGQGSLVDPFFGVFDSGCSPVASYDYGGVALNARGYITVPEDGVFTIAATFCCDYGFQGGGLGTYRLTAQIVAVANSVRARLVDARTGEPLPGTLPPFSYVELYRVAPSGPELIAWINPDDNGEFVFESDALSNPLTVGDYQIMAYTYGYEIFSAGPFSLAEGEVRDLGDLLMHPIRVIGSISGRLVDSVDGRPIGGDYPSVQVRLLRCDDDDNCSFLGINYPQADGSFRFDPANSFPFVEPGNYRLDIDAYQYESKRTPLFPVAEDEDVDLGDIPLAGLPIQFVEQRSCTSVPAGGGTCAFSVKVRNGSHTRVKGEVWARVDSYGTGSPLGVTTFQIGRAGTSSPAPQKINLASGQEQWINFQFDVPSFSGDISVSCVRTLAGQEPSPLFNTVGEGFQFCFFKEYGEASIVSGKKAWEKYEELKRNSRP